MIKLAETTLETVKNSFPQIIKIALEIAYDNGMINRSETEETYLTRIADVVANRPLISVIQLEIFLHDLTNAQLSLIAAVEHQDGQDQLVGCKDIGFANVLFDEFFEGE